jgi:hypothetical protein
MTEQHSQITPPPKLVHQWRDRWPTDAPPNSSLCQWLATQAARWGADQELEACCAWLPKLPPWSANDLRRHRRPKPPSLKEQAQRILVENGTTLDGRMELDPDDIAILRRAVEQLDD